MSRELVAPRITVLDAGELDVAIFGILKSQTNNAVKYLPAWILNKYSLELETLLKLLIWKFSIGKHQASFGQQLLHLKYSDSTKYRNLQALAFLTIGLPYLKEKILSKIKDENKERAAHKFVEDIESAVKILNILTFVRFLWRGGPSTFLELLLRLKPISTVPQSTRNIGYSYMTRELIWHGFIELLLILLPLINYHRLRRYISKILYGSSKKQEYQMSTFNSSTTCNICKEPPILPHQMGCTHAFCYLCLASHREADKNFECPECGFSNPDPNCMQPVQIALLPRSVALDDSDGFDDITLSE